MKRLTTLNIQAMKDRGESIAMVTAYDATFAKLIDQAGADMLLVGDSLGMVVQGHDSTLPVTMDHMVYHTEMVVRGSQKALVVADMPFLSYQVSVGEAVANAGRLMQTAQCQAVKLEGGQRSIPAVEAIVNAGIPVVGHLGLTPQSVNTLGGFKVQGRDSEAAQVLLEDARRLQEAGAFALVLETIPGSLATEVSQELTIPTIGIGAGVGCDGQVLVCYDLLGLMEDFTPKFLRRFANLGERIRAGVGDYVAAVKDRRYPADEHTFK